MIAMKNFFSILLSSILLLGFAGCGDGKPAATTGGDTIGDTASSHEAVAEAGITSAIESSSDGDELLFTHGVLHDIEIAITQEEWDGLINDMKKYARTARLRRGVRGNYPKATFIYKGTAGETTIGEV